MVAAKSSRVNRQYKKKYRIRNWREYERGLRSRGDVTIWLSEDAIAAWVPTKNGLRGGQRRYSNLAVRTALTLRVVFSLPLRQTEGFLDSLLRLMGLNLKAPDHTTLSRRFWCRQPTEIGDNWDMAHRKTERNPLFAGRWFEDDIILLCRRWYFRFQLSYRDLVAILGERGLSISHTTILRWVIRYAEPCEKRWGRFERQVSGSWRVDETFIKVRGQWMYLYRAVDGQGNTVEFFFSRARGIAAAKAFFRKALKHHREPHSITLDGHRPSHSALRHMGMNGEFNFRGRNPVKIRCCQYLNNVVEQDHRRVKGRLRSMLGFKTFYNARRVIIGIELAQKIHKRQFAIPITWQSNPAVIWRHVMAA